MACAGADFAADFPLPGRDRNLQPGSTPAAFQRQATTNTGTYWTDRGEPEGCRAIGQSPFLGQPRR